MEFGIWSKLQFQFSQFLVQLHFFFRYQTNQQAYLCCTISLNINKFIETFF